MPVAEIRYYLSAIWKIITGLENWPVAFAVALLGLFSHRPHAIIRLKNGIRFTVRTALDVLTIGETCIDRSYEKASIPIQDGWIIIDVGASIGDFAIDAARQNPSGTVYAHEPYPGSFTLLQANLELNGVTNVRAFPCAVGSGTGLMQLAIDKLDPLVYRAARAGEVNGKVIEVPCFSLDDILTRHGIERCDYLKMDCEGAEHDILFHTSPGTLARIRHICLEYHDCFTDLPHTALVEFLTTKGFEVRVHELDAHPDVGLIYAANTHVE